MKIAVCIKQVPDTEARIKIGADGRSIDEAGVNLVVSPFDEYAVEEALRLREKHGGEVVAYAVGDDRAATALRTVLAMGVDRAVHLKDAAFEGSDGLGISRILAAALRLDSFDLVLFGKQAVGTDRGQVGPRVAELLDLPHVSVVVALSVEGGRLRGGAGDRRGLRGGGEPASCGHHRPEGARMSPATPP